MINGRPRELEIVDVIGKLYQFSKQAPEIAIHTNTFKQYIHIYGKDGSYLCVLVFVTFGCAYYMYTVI